MSQTLEYFKISIFGIILAQSLGIRPPGGIYRVTPNFYAIDIGEISIKNKPNCIFVVTLCYLMSKTGKIFALYKYWGHFWSNLVYLTPWVQMFSVPSTVKPLILNK